MPVAGDGGTGLATGHGERSEDEQGGKDAYGHGDQAAEDHGGGAVATELCAAGARGDWCPWAGAAGSAARSADMAPARKRGWWSAATFAAGMITHAGDFAGS
ncbi:hypothetical protein DLE60_32160 [Micromonospora globispora]|nr:hypothetical protein DLE60_32160 [Micromonospora globispora]